MLRARSMSLACPISAVITFGVFSVDSEKGELRRLGTVLHLPPQPFQVLVLLASRPGEVVTREAIQEQLWGLDTFVDFERGLNHCIRQIRAVLGDDPGAPTYIETVPRTGYRFVAPVTMVIPPLPADGPSAGRIHELRQPEGGKAKAGIWTRRRRQIVVAATAVLLTCGALLVAFQRGREARQEAPPFRQMVAVLPFENLTGDPAQEYLSDGVTDEMIVHLG